MSVVEGLTLPEFVEVNVLVIDGETVALGVDRVNAPVPEIEEVALAGATGLIVCGAVGKFVTDGDRDVDTVCVGVTELERVPVFVIV